MKLTIQGVRPWDGTYDFDVAEFTTREWGWIKRFAGYLPGDVEKGFEGADPELISVFAVIALRRAGRIDVGEAAHVYDRFADAPFGAAVRLVGDTIDADEAGDDDAGPPPQSSPANESSSGLVSLTPTATSNETPNGHGTHDLVTSAYGQETSET